MGILPERNAPSHPVIGASRVRLDGPGAALAAVAGVFLILGAAAGSAAAPSVGGLEVRPTHFSPNGDGTNDTAEVLFTPAGAESLLTVDLSVARVSDDSTFAVLLSGAARVSGGLIQETWAPGVIGDGRYRFDITVTDSSGSVSDAAEVTADSTPPVVSLINFSQSPFDPGDVSLTFDVSVASDSGTTTTVTVEQFGAVLQTLGSSPGPGVTGYTWDGTLTGGTSASSAKYDVRASAVDLAGNSGLDLQTVTLDRDPPGFEVDQGDTVETTAFPVTLSGLAIDDDRVDQVLVSFDSSQTFVPADFVSAPDDSVTFQVLVNDPAPQPGRRRVVLRAVDAYGHTADETRIIAYDTFFPAVTSTRVVDADGSVTDGDSLTVETIWNAAGLIVSADFSALDSGSGPPLTIDQGGGIYSIAYRVSPTNSRSGGVKDIVVKASTGFLATSDTVQVTLVDRHGAREASVDRNRFDPLAGETVTIASSSPSSAVAVEVFGLSGRRVRFLEASGFVEWDGRNEEGVRVASGVYFLKVTVDGAEEVRKVAVLRGGSR